MFVQNEYHNEKMQNDKGYLEEYIYYTFVGFTNLCIQSMYVFNPFVFVIFLFCGGVGAEIFWWGGGKLSLNKICTALW